MSGGLQQMQAVGTADMFLTARPTISFWKARTKRYTAFATEAVQCVWNNAVGFGRRSTAMLPKTGDLVSTMWLEIALPDLAGFIATPNTATNIRWAQTVALIIISSIQLEVGSVRIDQYPGYYHDYWSELALPYEKQRAFDKMVGKYEHYDNTQPSGSSASARTYFVPLLFFPNTTSHLAIPACSLLFNEIRVNIELRNYLDCVRSSMAPVQSLIDQAGNALEVKDVRLYVDFVYLSAPEKQRFVSTQHDMLFTYLQEAGQTAVTAGTQTAKVPLTFSNLVQELIFVYQPKASVTSNTMTGNAWTDVIDAFLSVDLQVDGSSRFTPRSSDYFIYGQPYDHHTACPRKPVHCYSFARRPEEVQPSGTINASRVSSMFFNFTLRPGVPDGYINVYARAFNILTISNGRSGLRFA